MGNRRDIENDSKQLRNLFSSHRTSLDLNDNGRMSVEQDLRGAQMLDAPPSLGGGDDFGEEFVYQGEAIHGSLDAFNKAIMEGSDPLVNGTEYFSRMFSQIAPDPDLLHTLGLSEEDYQALGNYAESLPPSQTQTLDRNGAGTNMEVDAAGLQDQAKFETSPFGGNVFDAGSQIGPRNSPPYAPAMQQFVRIFPVSTTSSC